MDEKMIQKYINILENELIYAQGCTEPIAIAFAAAKAREVLGDFPERLEVGASGNIIKNVKSVIIPNTNGLYGIEAAAVAGAVAGNSNKKLELLASLSGTDIEKVKSLLAKENYCTVHRLNNGEKLHIIIEAEAKGHRVFVEVKRCHTNVTKIVKNGEVIYEEKNTESSDESQNCITTDYSCLSVEAIIKFANSVDLERVRGILERQYECNMKISEEGLTNFYGANVGKILRKNGDDSVRNRAKYSAAAGSDARMNGCLLPVVINSGSGNQGITASVPVIVYSQEWGKTKEQCLRAMLVSNLIAIHQKSMIGSLSAFCGAVTAACGSGAALTYMKGGTLKQIEMTIKNALGNMSGLFCDGAKSSCAAKIATTVDAAIMAHEMSMEGQVFGHGEGIVDEEIEVTMRNVGRIGAEGMDCVDNIILDIMVGGSRKFSNFVDF